MKLAELAQELAAGRIRPAYLVAGAEPLLRDDAVAALRAAVLADGSEDFDCDRLDGAVTRLAQLEDALRTLPVMAPRRLVLLRLPDGARGKALCEALHDVVSALGDEASAVLVAVTPRADARARWVRSFGDARIECDPPRAGREVVAFVRAEAKRQAVSLEPGAAELLADRVGPQLLVLRQEIAKASLFAGAGQKVTRSHVASGSPDVAEEPIWDLTDAIGEGRSGDALAVLAKLLGGGAPPPVLLGSLASHFRRLLRLGSGGRVSGPPFVQRKLEGQSRRYGQRRLTGALRAVHETDLALKGEGGLRPELALERLVLSLSA